MDGIQFEELVPWYKGFTGEIKANEKNNFDAKGVFQVLGSMDKVEITELPIKKWTRDYKNFLEEKIAPE